MDDLFRDLRYGWRMLRARPGFAAVAVLTLGLGVGANTAIFSAVNALLLRPLPIADVDDVVYGMALREGFDPFGTSFLDYALYRDQARSFASTGLATQRQFNLVGRTDPEPLNGAAVTASYLDTLGVRPQLGRLFADDEDRAGGPAVALVSHGLWQRSRGESRAKERSPSGARWGPPKAGSSDSFSPRACCSLCSAAPPGCCSRTGRNLCSRPSIPSRPRASDRSSPISASTRGCSRSRSR